MVECKMLEIINDNGVKHTLGDDGFTSTIPYIPKRENRITRRNRNEWLKSQPIWFKKMMNTKGADGKKASIIEGEL